MPTRNTMILWNKRYTLWMRLVGGACLVALFWMGRQAHGDLFLPGASSGPSVAEFSSIARALSEGNAALARTQIDEMKTKTPDLPHREVILAQMLIQSGMIAEGRLLLEELAAVEPDRYDVRFLFCHLAVIEQRWFEAWHHAIATERLAVPNEWSEAYRSTLRRELAMLKGLACEGRRDWKGATEAYEMVTKESPILQAWVGLGRVHFRSGRTDDAMHCFKQAQQLDVNADLPEVMIAAFYANENNVIEAEKWFRIAMESKEAGAEHARLAFAKWLINVNRPREVAGVISFTPSNAEVEKEVQFTAALVARMLGMHHDAQKLLSKLHQAELSNALVRNHLALSLIEDTDEAARMRASQLAMLNVRSSPTDAEAWATLGWIQLRLGDIAAAEESLRTSTRSGRASRDTAYYLSRLYEAKGQPLEAAELRKTIEQATGPYFYGYTEAKSE